MALDMRNLRIIRIAALVFGLIMSAMNYAQEPVRIEKVWIRSAPPSASAFAGYGIIVNQSNSNLELTGISSIDFEAIEFHNSVLKNGSVRMEQVKSIIISKHGQQSFQPGGHHLMLLNPKRKFKIGDTSALIFHFSNNLRISVAAEVRQNDL